MFTTEHLIWLLLCAVFVAGMGYVSCRFRFSFHRSACIMAMIALCSEFSKILSEMQFVNGTDATEGMVISAEALPLHLCSMLIFVFFYFPFSRPGRLRDNLVSFFVPVGLIGATIALLIPTNGTDFRTLGAYQCFVYHGGMVWFAGYLLATGQVELGLRAFFRNAAVLFGLTLIMIWVNGALQCYDTNFLFVVRPPMEGLPILNLNHGWYAYYARLVICGVVGLSMVHGLWGLCRMRKNAKTAEESPGKVRHNAHCTGQKSVL